MSIHNYKQGDIEKSWADIVCNDLTADNVSSNDMSVSAGLTVADLNITNFVLGAVESDNAYVPVFLNQTGSLANAFALKGGYARKINNLVKVRLIVETTAAAAGIGGFEINRTNLPIAKVSSFTDLDRCAGICMATRSGEAKAGAAASDTAFPSDIIAFEFEGLTNAVVYQLNIEFDYTTD